MSAPTPGVFIHATALIIGAQGLLLRGSSGAGKSALALALIAQAQAAGDFARLVADDRVLIEARNGHLIARPHPSICGLIEARGAGLLRLPYAPACVLHLVIDVVAPGETAPRLPEESEKYVELQGVALPRFYVAGGAGDVARRLPALMRAALQHTATF